MTFSLRRILKSLPLQMVVPVVAAICLVGIGLYFFVLRAVSEFADEQIKEALANIASEVYDICDDNTGKNCIHCYRHPTLFGYCTDPIASGPLS